MPIHLLQSPSRAIARTVDIQCQKMPNSAPTAVISRWSLTNATIAGRTCLSMHDSAPNVVTGQTRSPPPEFVHSAKRKTSQTLSFVTSAAKNWVDRVLRSLWHETAHSPESLFR